MPSKDKFLVIEDSTTVQALICHIGTRAGYEVDTAASMQETEQLLSQGHQYQMASIDYNLPDAPNGEVIDLVLSHDIPSVVLTGRMDDKTRDNILSRPVVDYVPKETAQAFSYIGKLLERIRLNKTIRVLVVDDSKPARSYIRKLLERHQFLIAEAGDGDEALEVLAKHPDIKLIITDHEMPKRDGINFVSTVRRQYDKDSLAIIGLSGANSGSLSARFIKNGANDFLKKPFCHEEFYCRVVQNIENLEFVTQINLAANTDFMTGLYNRRFFFEKAPDVIDRLSNLHKPISLAMIDIDHFKTINDTYGHDAGDEVIKLLSNKLTEAFEDCMVARFGGEEFCIFMPDYNGMQAMSELDSLRQDISEFTLEYESEEIEFTISIGVTSTVQEIDQMITTSDNLLYDAKHSGRNRVTSDDKVTLF